MVIDYRKVFSNRKKMKKMKKITIVVGTRPEIIRFAPIISEIKNRKNIQIFFIHTDQHYSEDMNDLFFKELNIKEPDMNLSVGKLEPTEQIGKIISHFGKVLEKIKTDIVCVWGDTNSSLGAAIATNKMKIKLCHIESGCRSHDFRMAEEYNRILIDHLSDLLFPVSYNDYNNLLIEKVHGKSIFLGDPLYDVFLSNQKIARKYKSTSLKPLDDCSVLLTLHRAENVDNIDTLKNILVAVNKIKFRKIVFPIHPRTKKMIENFGLNNLLNNNIKTISPLGYFEILRLLQQCDLVITDSGGLQKETFFAKKTCVTLRKSTEWIDTVNLKVNILLDPESKQIEKLSQICQNVGKTNALFKKITERPYGNGHSSIKIVDAIINEIK
mgnify:FL=1